MRKLREKRIEGRSDAWAKRRGWWSGKFKTPSHRARPDRIFCLMGKIVFWEFKAQGEEPTELQYKEHEEMRAAGMDVRWTDNFEKFEREMTQLERRILGWLQ